MFDFHYNEGIAFTPIVSVLKAEAEKTQEEIEETQAAVAENTEAIENEGEVREAADQELSDRIDSIPKFKIKVVDELPETGDSATLYLVKVSDEEGNRYEEYIYADGVWESLGPVLDLSDYVTKEEFEEAFDGVYTKDEIDVLLAPLAVKADVDAALALKANSADVEAEFANVNAALETKANSEDVDAALALKANSADMDAALALKADSSDVDAALALKANSADVDSALATKANSDDVDAALALKANSADVDAALALKADAAPVYAVLETKADAAPVYAALNTKANSSDVDAALALKANTADVDNALALKADSVDVYTKDEADAKFLTEHQDISNLATKDELADAIAPLAVADDVNAALALKADASNVYTKAQLDAFLAGKTDREVNGTNGKSLIFNETDGGGAKFEHNDGTWSFAGVNDGGENGLAGQIYAVKKNASDKFEGARIDVTKDGMYYTVGDATFAERKAEANEIAVKGDVADVAEDVNTVEEEVIGLANTVSTKSEQTYVDNEIYKLTTIVGDIGGAVTYELPNPAGKSFNALMSNNGTVKLTDDVETGRFGPGITAKNTTKLNLNGHDLTITGLTTSSTQPAIMSRGTENLTIYGKGTIDAGGGVCIEANGVDSVINLTGSTTVYRTNRSGGELIYCYAGTINITNGTFRNDGANTAYLLNCYDANYKADPKKANIIVSSTSKTNGPKFYDFNPADNSAEGEHTNFVAEGCEVVVSTVVEEEVEHTVYTVVKSAESE